MTRNAETVGGNSIMGLMMLAAGPGTSVTVSATGPDAAEASPRLRQFAESFTYGTTGSICSPDYAPFFDASVSVIDTACQEFEPPG